MTTEPWRRVINCADHDANPYHVYAGATHVATIAQHDGAEDSAELIVAAPQTAAAARAMLAALRDAEKILAQLDAAGQPVHIELRETRAAIAQADAAGITAKG